MFNIPLPIYFFTKARPSKTLNKRRHIPLFINQFVSLTELKRGSEFSVTKSSYETELQKMMSHFELLTQKLL